MVYELDQFLQNLGSKKWPGRYQTFIFMLLATNYILMSLHNLNDVFLGVVPEHHCKITGNYSINQSIPWETINNKEQLSQCTMYVNPRDHSLGVQACNNGWDYYYPGGEWTIVAEWDLVCSRKYLVGLSTTIYFLGTLVASSPMGMLSDRFGRKTMLLTNLGIHIVIGIIQFFSVSFAMFAILKFCHGVVIQGIANAATSLIFELCRRHRTEVAIFANESWAVGQWVLALLAYLIPNWRYLYLALSVPSLIGISYIWVMPESLRWLLANDKVDRAVKVTKRYIRINHLKMEPDDVRDKVEHIVAVLQQGKDANKKRDARDLFRTKYIRRATVTLLWMWFSSAVAYYGVTGLIHLMAGSIYVNFTISTAIEFGARLVLYPILKKLGRRTPSIISFIAAGVCCIIAVVLQYGFQGDAFTTAAIGFALAVKGFSAACITCMMLYNSELFPTVIRGAAGGAGGFANRLGSMVAPQVLLMGSYVNEMIPLIVLGTCSIIAGFTCLVNLPETFRTALPDTIQEAEALCSRGKIPMFYQPSIIIRRTLRNPTIKISPADGEGETIIIGGDDTGSKETIVASDELAKDEKPEVSDREIKENGNEGIINVRFEGD